MGNDSWARRQELRNLLSPIATAEVAAMTAVLDWLPDDHHIFSTQHATRETLIAALRLTVAGDAALSAPGSVASFVAATLRESAAAAAAAAAGDVVAAAKHAAAAAATVAAIERAAVTDPEGYGTLVRARARYRHHRREVEAAEECRRVGVPHAPTSSLRMQSCPLGVGESGWVLKGTCGGTEAAIKVVRGSASIKALMRTLKDAEIYKVLRALQGGVLPRLLAVGRLPDGYGFLAMTLIHGTPLSELPAITPTVAAAAEAALAQLHALGVAHGDIRLANLLLVDGMPAGAPGCSGAQGAQGPSSESLSSEAHRGADPSASSAPPSSSASPKRLAHDAPDSSDPSAPSASPAHPAAMPSSTSQPPPVHVSPATGAGGPATGSPAETGERRESAPRVVVVDFGRAHVTTDQQELADELQELRRVLRRAGRKRGRADDLEENE